MKRLAVGTLTLSLLLVACGGEGEPTKSEKLAGIIHPPGNPSVEIFRIPMNRDYKYRAGQAVEVRPEQGVSCKIGVEWVDEEGNTWVEYDTVGLNDPNTGDTSYPVPADGRITCSGNPDATRLNGTPYEDLP